MRKKVSIILCTYNEVDYIEPTISLISKTLKDVEIIIVDDNSDDGTLEKFEKLKSTFNFKLIVRKNESGLATAHKRGFEESTGDYIGTIDVNNKDQILSTIKSRCIEFKIFFSESNKKNIFKKIVQQYDGKFESGDLSKYFYFETPGNLIKFLLFFKTLNVDLYASKLSVISYLIESYKNEKNYEILNYLLLFVEIFFYDLCLNDPKNFNR